MASPRESDPLYHTQRIQGMMQDLITHLRDDVGQVNDPQAKALFEVSAEVLEGLHKAFQHYEKGAEEAWEAPKR